MTLSFNSIPANTRLPFSYIEFNNTNATQGPARQVYNVLIMGQLLSSGTKSSLSINQVTNESQAREWFGAGSQLFTMIKKFREINKSVSLTAIPISDDGSGVDATGNVVFTGTATDSGAVYFYIAGKKYSVSVLSGDAGTDICAAMVAEINADVDAILVAAIDGSDDTQMNLTTKNAGEAGNEIDLRFNYRDEQTVEGITTTITALASGANNPDISDIIAVLDDTQYHVVVSPWTDTANLDALETELADRWGPTRQKEGAAITGKRDSFADLSTFGSARNNKHETIVPTEGPSSPWDVAAQVAGAVARQGQIDPARPIQNILLPTILPPSPSERFVDEERNLLLYDGISTLKVVGGKVYIERLITTYQTNASGADDESYLSLETMLTLSYLRYDFRTGLLTEYPNHKLGDDGNRYGPGQPIITPLIGKAFAVGKFVEWQERALVENIEQFKDDLIVERDESNPDRLNFLLSPDLINQMRIFGVQMAYIL